MPPLLDIDDLAVDFPSSTDRMAVDGVSLAIDTGEIVGIVGESGSGKSMTLYSCLGLVPPPGRIVRGSIRFDGQELIGRPDDELRRLRGSQLGMVLQDPMTSLHPALTIGKQMINVIRAHHDISPSEAVPRALEALEMAGVSRAQDRMAVYPHQLSGGLRQRVLIAAAIVNRPRLLLADEPTTALDVTVQAQILELLRDLNRDLNITVVLVTHNFGVVAGLCDRTIVMRHGCVLEDGPTTQVFAAPTHEYTQRLLAAVPRIDVPSARPARPPVDDADQIVMRTHELSQTFESTPLFGQRSRITAMKDITIDVHRGETLGLVGESGAGKTTLARTMIRLQEPGSGQLIFDGRDVTHVPDHQLRDFRRRVQMIFQDPYSSLDPRWTVEQTITEPLLFHGLCTREQVPERARALVDMVGLSERLLQRLPRELSGGERQRVAIGRALAAEPDVVIADEPVSALDVSTQAQIVRLFDDLQTQLGLTLILVSHDLGLVRSMCDRVAVMRAGEIVEYAPSEELFLAPAHPYTRVLMACAPVLEPELARDRAREYQAAAGALKQTEMDPA